MSHLRNFFKSDSLLRLLLYGWNLIDLRFWSRMGNILRPNADATFHRDNQSCLISSEYISVSFAPALSLVSVRSVWLSLVTVTLLSSPVSATAKPGWQHSSLCHHWFVYGAHSWLWTDYDRGPWRASTLLVSANKRFSPKIVVKTGRFQCDNGGCYQGSTSGSPEESGPVVKRKVRRCM